MVARMRAARTDANQNDIVDALRKIGAFVWITSSLGNGGPDIVIGYRGKTYLVELKDGEKSASRTALTPAECDFHAAWRGGPLLIWYSVDDALEALK